MKRVGWKFEYTGAKLAEAAQARLEHRKERVEVWAKRKADLMQEIKDKGLTVDEGNAALYASNNFNPMGSKGIHGPQVVVDVQLQANMSEAHTKLESHRHFLREYDGWVKVFTAHPDQTFKLNHDDWLYFFEN